MAISFAENISNAFVANRYAARIVPGIVLVARLGILMTVYVLIDRWVTLSGRLPQDSYEQSVIGIELVKHMGLVPILLVGLVVAGVHFFRTGIWQTWDVFDHSAPLRWFILLTAGILAWVFATYDYNLYFNQGHYFDRLALIGLAILIYWRPAFVFPFLLLIMGISWQFEYPLGASYIQADFYPLIRILMVFGALFIWYLFTRRSYIGDFVFIACCIVAANYWIPGLGKLRLDWLSHGHVYLMTLGAYAHGWLAFLDPETLVSIVQTVAPLDPVFLTVTILLECGALISLWRRKLFLVFIPGWILFHLGLFAAFGYFFWKWILIELGIAICFLRKKYEAQVPIFKIEYFAISLMLIYLSPYWAKPAGLAWYDTRLCYSYRLEAQGDSGEMYTLPPRFFGPYDLQFTMAMFGALSQRQQLVYPYGISASRDIADRLLHITDPAQVPTLEAELGGVRYNGVWADRFDDLLTQYVSHRNVRGSSSTWLSVIKPPPLFWSFARGRAFDDEERIARVIVYHNTSMYDGKQYLDIRREIVREVDIPETGKKG